MARVPCINHVRPCSVLNRGCLDLLMHNQRCTACPRELLGGDMPAVPRRPPGEGPGLTCISRPAAVPCLDLLHSSSEEQRDRTPCILSKLSPRHSPPSSSSWAVRRRIYAPQPGDSKDSAATMLPREPIHAPSTILGKWCVLLSLVSSVDL